MLHISSWTKCAIGILLLASLGLVSLNFIEIGGWLGSKKIGLGLDLRGGAQLLLETDIDSVVRERLGDELGLVRKKLLEEGVSYEDLRTSIGGIQFKVSSVERDEIRGKLGSFIQRYEISVGKGGLVEMELRSRIVEDWREGILEQTITIVRRRIDESGTKESIIMRQGKDRVLLQLPGISDPGKLKSLLGKTAKLTFHIVEEGNSASYRSSSRVVIYSFADENSGSLALRRKIELSGEHLSEAGATLQNGEPVVNFILSGSGRRRFSEVTGNNIGKRLAIVLDKKIISAPVIREQISGGRGIISGRFTTEGAYELALLLNAGALPAPLVVIEDRTVGAALGKDTIRIGIIGGISGLILVVLSMIWIYGIYGIISCIGLLTNIILIGGTLTFLNVTLTLPGIIGLILTIGMAVDANVLIYERIVEEGQEDRSKLKTVEEGFRQAFVAILDSNITTFLASIVLFGIASGFIRGFAVVLCIGILSSLVTAYLVTRILVVSSLKSERLERYTHKLLSGGRKAGGKVIR